jgi:hypothetical protein
MTERSLHRFQIPVANLDEVRMWFRERGGVLVWTNKEIGYNRPDMFTPKLSDKGVHVNAPHWAYVGEPTELKPEDLSVNTTTEVQMPLDWFPVCEHCKGTGKRALADLAKARREPIKTTRASIADGTICNVEVLDEQTIACAWCGGTGHTDRYIHVAIRKRYWGIDISDTGKARAQKLAKKLGEDVQYDWYNDGYGKACLKFFREKLEPFTME